MEVRGAIPTAGLADGVITVESGVITAVGPAGGQAGRRPGGDVILPGLIDIHCHGGGGAGFATLDPAEAAAAAGFHAARGTTGVLASLVTAAVPELAGQLRALAPLVASGELLGIHLEGPFLAPSRRGAHDASLLRAPDEALAAELVDAARPGGGRSAIRVVTLAPELPGADAVAAVFRDAGAVVAFGHTDAGYDVMAAALAAAGRAHAAAGRALVTHLGNAMPPPHHRAAGPVAAALVAAARDLASVELIADGVHVDAGFTRLVFAAAAPGRVILVTDAIAAAGMPDGRYRLGALPVSVAGGVARLAGPPGAGGGGALAGGTRTLLEVVATAVGSGIGLPEAVRAASESPARLLGLAAPAREGTGRDGTARAAGEGRGGTGRGGTGRDGLPGRGGLAPGMAADLVLAGPDLRLRRVMRAGRWIAGAA